MDRLSLPGRIILILVFLPTFATFVYFLAHSMRGMYVIPVGGNPKNRQMTIALVE